MVISHTLGGGGGGGEMRCDITSHQKYINVYNIIIWVLTSKNFQASKIKIAGSMGE